MPESIFSIFLIPLTAMALMGFICFFWLRRKRSPETVQGVATLLGIAGTFAGIIFALSGLNFEDLASSIPALLGGMFFAFFSSLMGVAVSLLVYFFPRFWRQEEEAIDSESDIDSQILRAIKELNKNMVGKQDELIKSFDVFAEKMADNNMKALEEVIKDFNTKLQEQFGENFKQLNLAVHKLLDWQENYKETVEKTSAEVESMIKMLKSSNDSIGVSADALQEITKSADSFRENADALKTQLGEARNTIGEINEFASGLGGASDVIKGNMEDITGKVLEDLGQNLKGISEALVRDYQEIQRVFERMKNSQ